MAVDDPLLGQYGQEAHVVDVGGALGGKPSRRGGVARSLGMAGAWNRLGSSSSQQSLIAASVI